MPFRCLSEPFENHADQKFVIYTQDRNELHQHLTDNKIESRIHYPYALSELPIAKDIIKKPDLISTSIALSRGVLSLPIYPELTDSEIEAVADTVCKFFVSRQIGFTNPPILSLIGYAIVLRHLTYCFAALLVNQDVFHCSHDIR